MVYFLRLIGVYSNKMHFLPVLLPNLIRLSKFYHVPCSDSRKYGFAKEYAALRANPTRETLSSAFPQLLLAPKTEIYYDRIGKNRGKEGQP